MSISYFVSGRFGNNLFQYFATKVLGKILNKEYVFNGSKKPLSRGVNNEKIKIDNLTEVDDEKFNEIISNSGSSIEGDIYVVGFFQTQDWITLYRDYIQSLFTEENMDRINDDYTISHIVKHVSKIKPVRDDILIVHLRLDDFFHNIKKRDIFIRNFSRAHLF